jgi:trimeric autotransporter adhesin
MRYTALFAIIAVLLASCNDTKPAENKAPTVTLAAAPASIVAGTSSVLTATAADTDGTIAKVDFFDSDGKLLVSDTSSPYSYSYASAATDLGDKTFTAKATDDKGLASSVATTKVTVTAPVVIGNARVRVVHASADAPAVDVQVDDKPVADLTNVAFGVASGYLTLPAKSINVKVFATGTTTGAVINAPLVLADKVDYTVLAVGKVANIAPLVLTDNNTLPATGKIKLRVVHAAAGVPNVNVYVTAPGAALPAAADATLKNVPFKAASDYLEVNAGDYQVRVTPADSQTVAIDVPTVALTAGKIYTAIALDPKAPATVPTIKLLTDN